MSPRIILPLSGGDRKAQAKGIRYRARVDFNWGKKQRATSDEKKGHGAARWSRPLRVTGRRQDASLAVPRGNACRSRIRREPLQPSILFHLAEVPFFSSGRAIIRDAGRTPWKNSQPWTRWSRC